MSYRPRGLTTSILCVTLSNAFRCVGWGCFSWLLVGRIRSLFCCMMWTAWCESVHVRCGNFGNKNCMIDRDTGHSHPQVISIPVWLGCRLVLGPMHSQGVCITAKVGIIHTLIPLCLVKGPSTITFFFLFGAYFWPVFSAQPTSPWSKSPPSSSSNLLGGRGPSCLLGSRNIRKIIGERVSSPHCPWQSNVARSLAKWRLQVLQYWTYWSTLFLFKRERMKCLACAEKIY
jgi:hypothetical protein